MCTAPDLLKVDEADKSIELGNISLSNEEYLFLKKHCDYLTADYLEFLKEFQLRPREQVDISFTTVGADTGSDNDIGEVDIKIKGSWVDTILYEIPLLALTSEAYFRYMDTDWVYDGQEEKAYEKGMQLLEAGCITSEFGTRRRPFSAAVLDALTRPLKTRACV